LTDFFFSNQWKNELNKRYEYNNFANQWNRLLNGLWEENCTISPNSLFRLMIKISKEKNLPFGFSSYKQNDIHEFIIFVLDILHESFGYSLENPKNTLEEFYKNKYSKIIDLFYGETETVILDINTNKKLSSNTQPTCFFLLPIPNKVDITLKDCINLYLEEELLDGENKWYNEKNKNYILAKKKIKIKTCPKILILCLSRFTNNGNKINNEITVTESLQFNKKKYSLYGICNHMGSSSGGHYIAQCKNNNEWYRFNDGLVTKINNLNLSASSIYCLFYRLN
jgi:ubiquitin C-terminal hydrolase